MKVPRARTVRRAAERELLKQGRRAEGRGRAVPPTVGGFQDALRTSGFDGIAEALISRHNQRLQRIDGISTMTQVIYLPHMAGYLPFDVAVLELGGHPGRPPIHSGRTWVDHLAWGLDSVASAVRLLLCLQPIGATVIARTQLERWSSNLEFNSGLSQQPGEDTVTWLNRLWNQPGTLLQPGGTLTNARVGHLFGDLSELLHGRGPLMPLVWLDVVDLGDQPSSKHVKLTDTITESLTISLSRIRDGLATAAGDNSWDVLAETIRAVTLVKRSEGWLPDTKAYLYPLVPTFFRQDGVDGQLGAMASGHHRVLESLRAGRSANEPPGTWPVLALGERRFRASVVARLAFEHEREQLGSEFNKMGIEDLTTESILAGEMAGVLATWLRNDSHLGLAADAFAACASALRSAVWLWLEDDERAMGCLRPVIEQLARARTWRTKPAAATKIEASPKSTPRDWIETAGWRRLSLLSRALGEFAHGSAQANPTAARDALVALQHDPTNELAKYTGRTHALTALIHFLQVECAHWLGRFDADLEVAYWRVVRLDRESADRAMEYLMQRAWTNRRHPLR